MATVETSEVTFDGKDDSVSVYFDDKSNVQLNVYGDRTFEVVCVNPWSVMSYRVTKKGKIKPV